MFAIIETDCAQGIGKRECRSPWWGSKQMLACYKEYTKGRVIVMGYDTFRTFPMNRFDSKQTYIVLSISETRRRDAHDNVLFMNMSDFEHLLKVYEREYVLVGGYTMFNLLMDHIHEMCMVMMDATYNECDLFFPIYERDWEITRIRKFGKIIENVIKKKG